MKTLRFLHTADWHADGDPKKQIKLRRSLDQMLAYVQSNKVNAIIHSGDIWEKKQSYAKQSGVPLVIDYLKAMSKHVDFIFITKGNNSHDEPGSVTLLHQLEPNIYAYEYPVVLKVRFDAITKVKNILKDEYESPNGADYIVSLMPYPTKAMFIKEQSIDLNNDEFISMFEGIFDLIADKTAMYSCPKILAFHGNVVGSRLSTGQTLLSQDIMVSPNTLKKAKHDYYALGHIHLRQEVQPNMVYSGSIYNKNWGDTEQKSFEIIEFKK
jgi:exonuclease SbcD